MKTLLYSADMHCLYHTLDIDPGQETAFSYNTVQGTGQCHESFVSSAATRGGCVGFTHMHIVLTQHSLMHKYRCVCLFKLNTLYETHATALKLVFKITVCRVMHFMYKI